MEWNITVAIGRYPTARAQTKGPGTQSMRREVGSKEATRPGGGMPRFMELGLFRIGGGSIKRPFHWSCSSPRRLGRGWRRTVGDGIGFEALHSGTRSRLDKAYTGGK